MFFALLLINVFVVKEMHYAFDHDHDHSHHQLTDRHADCGEDVHFHSYEFEAACHICDFNFSPTEIPTVDLILLSPTISERQNPLTFSFFIGSFLDILSDRGPPAYFI